MWTMWSRSEDAEHFENSPETKHRTVWSNMKQEIQGYGCGVGKGSQTTVLYGLLS